MRWPLSRIAGFMGLNFVKSQSLLSTQTLFELFQDYSMYLFVGSPKEGKTFHQVKDLLLKIDQDDQKGLF